MYVNGSDRKNLHEHDRDHGYTDDQGRYHRDQGYDGEKEERTYDDDPDIPLSNEDRQKGIDPSYRKHKKMYYVWTHIFIEAIFAIILGLLFIIANTCFLWTI